MDKAIIRERIYNYRHSYHHWIIGVFKEDGHVWFSCDDFECYTGVKRWRHKLHKYYKKTGISYAITTEDGQLYIVSSALKHLIRFSKLPTEQHKTAYIMWLNNIENDMITTKDLEPENCKLIMLNAVKEANQDLQKRNKKTKEKPQMDQKKEYQKQYYKKNKERLKAYKREQYRKYVQNEENREKIRETQKKYRELHREEYNERHNKWYANLPEERKEKIREKVRNYDREHKEERIERNKNWYENNKERSKEPCKKWLEQNPDKAKERRKRYYEKNKDKLRQYMKEYQRKCIEAKKALNLLLEKGIITKEQIDETL